MLSAERKFAVLHTCNTETTNACVVSSLSNAINQIFMCDLNIIFPDIWKLCSITPVLKSGDASLVSNYRPISFLSHIAK